MPRPPRFSRRRILLSVLFLTAAAAALTTPALRGAGAQAMLSAPAPLPGDTPAPPPAAGIQHQPQLARGGDLSLAVWSDARTLLTNEAGMKTLAAHTATGQGSQTDIYAARVDAAGRVLDRTPIVVDQGGFEQTTPHVGWNGQNWLVVYLSQKEDDYFSYEIRAKRVSPEGVVLDASPVVLDPDAYFGQLITASVIDDGAGNRVVAYEDSLPPEGTAIPRGGVVTRVSGAVAVLEAGRVVYNHHSQFMGHPRMARAGDRYLLTFITYGPPYPVWGLTYNADFVPLRGAPVKLAADSEQSYNLATNGETWFVAWNDATTVLHIFGTRVSRDGDPLAPPLRVRENVGTAPSEVAVAWDGAFWFVAYGTAFDAATGDYLTGRDIYVSRVAPDGTLADAQGRPVSTDAGEENAPVVVSASGGGVQVGWYDAARLDVNTARVARDGAAGQAATLATAAPRQADVRIATDGAGFLAVFRSETSGVSRVMGQHLDAEGTPVEQEPFVISEGTRNGNPSRCKRAATCSRRAWRAATSSCSKSRLSPTRPCPRTRLSSSRPAA